MKKSLPRQLGVVVKVEKKPICLFNLIIEKDKVSNLFWRNNALDVFKINLANFVQQNLQQLLLRKLNELIPFLIFNYNYVAGRNNQTY